MKEAIDYKYDQLFQQFGQEIIKVGKVCVFLLNFIGNVFIIIFLFPSLKFAIF